MRPSSVSVRAVRLGSRIDPSPGGRFYAPSPSALDLDGRQPGRCTPPDFGPRDGRIDPGRSVGVVREESTGRASEKRTGLSGGPFPRSTPSAGGAVRVVRSGIAPELQPGPGSHFLPAT